MDATSTSTLSYVAPGEPSTENSKAKVEGVADPEQFSDDEGCFDGCHAFCGDKKDMCAVGLVFAVYDKFHWRG